MEKYVVATQRFVHILCDFVKRILNVYMHRAFTVGFPTTVFTFIHLFMYYFVQWVTRVHVVVVQLPQTPEDNLRIARAFHEVLYEIITVGVHV